jgi:peptidoglycan/LPS O-acetylase OafA/YrhL
VLTIFFSIMRPLFSLSQAFILFSAICPPTHPYYSSWIHSFLSLRIWTPIAKLSYLIYVLHYRIAVELIMTHSHLFDPKRFSIDSLTLPCLAAVLTVCFILSTVWFILVEKPFERLINMKLSNNQKSSRIE